jgi:hypothetical protein
VSNPVALEGDWGTKVFRPNISQDAKRKVHMARDNPRIAQSRQESNANRRRRELSFEVRDYVYLKVSPMRGL